MKNRITPFLMFEEGAQDAAKFYTTIFKNSEILSMDQMSSSFILDGQKFMAYNGGPHFNFSEGISLYVSCETQDEIDYYWEKLLEDGGTQSMCGWLKDKFGVSWQIVPEILGTLFASPEREKAERAIQAMLKMKKLEISKLKDAFEGK